MTTYTAVEGMLEVLDANPELMEAMRARILTREILELPRTVAELSASQVLLASALREFMETTNARLDSLESVAVGLSESQIRLENTLREFMEVTNARLDSLSASQIRLENTLREFMEATNARLDSLESAVVVLQRDMNEVKKTLGVMGQDINYLKGKHVEMDIQRRIHGILGGQGLRRTRVVRAAYPSIALPAFCDAVSDAVGDGRIAGDDYDRVMDTDLIARSRRRGFDWDVYVAVEASNRLDRDDVDRVERTHRILAAVFPKSEIRAMVYGSEISDTDRRHAESKGVETLLERRY